MPPVPDPAYLVPYGQLYGEKPNTGPHFICEGRHLVEEAITVAKSGQLKLVSLLCNSKHIDEWSAKVPTQTPILTLDARELNALVGFNFHRGVLCCCAVPEPPSEEQLLQASRLLVLPHLDNVDNLGQLIRTAAALGMDAIVIGRGPDPFARRSVRVSIGAVWKIPIIRHNSPNRLLDDWLHHRPDIETEIAGTAQTPDSISIWDWQPTPRTALVLGAESHGLDEHWQSKCSKHIRIPLSRNIDSLNVSAAGAILMGRMVE